MLRPTFALLLLLPFLLQEGPFPPDRPAGGTATKGKEPEPPPAARVLAAVADAARENAALPEGKRAAGDALADLLVRRAAAAAEGEGKPFLVALAHAFDPAATLARFPSTRASFAGLESPEAGEAWRRAMGSPTLRGRRDLLLHFTGAAALAALLGEETAAALTLAKEVKDARGGSGFSFADLLAGEAGIAFARRLLAPGGKRILAGVSASFRGGEHMPDPAGRPEGLPWEVFVKEYGALDDERFLAAHAAVRKAVAALPANGEQKGAEKEGKKEDESKEGR